MIFDLQINILKNIFGIKNVLEIKQAEHGLINMVLIITTDNGKFILKQHTNQDKQSIVYTHYIIKHANQQGIPTPLPIKYNNSEDIYVCNNTFYTLFPFIEGLHPQTNPFFKNEIIDMAKMLSNIHKLLKKTKIEFSRPYNWNINLTSTFERIKYLEMKIVIKDDFDRYALNYLKEQRSYLINISSDNLLNINKLPKQLIHGDYQSTNILIRNRMIVAILDWDLSIFSPPIFEVIRFINLNLKFSYFESCLFLKTYFEDNKISMHKLKKLVKLYSIFEATDLWRHENAYIKGNEKIRCLFEPSGYISIEQKWSKLFN